MKTPHLTLFATEAAYESAKATLTPPNVSHVTETGSVHYLPELAVPHSWLWDNAEPMLWDDGTEMIYRDEEE